MNQRGRSRPDAFPVPRRVRVEFSLGKAGVYGWIRNVRLVLAQCHLAYFRHAAMPVFALVRTGLASLMVAGASWLVPCWPGFLTG